MDRVWRKSLRIQDDLAAVKPEEKGRFNIPKVVILLKNMAYSNLIDILVIQFVTYLYKITWILNKLNTCL